MSIVAAFAVPHPPLIIPGVGSGREEIAATVAAYDEMGRRVAELAPDTVVISSPHSVMYADYIHISPGRGASGSFRQFGAPQARYEATYDQEFVHALVRACRRESLSAGCKGERDPSLDHGTMIPLHFIRRHIKDFEVVRMGISGLSPADHYRMGMLVQRVAKDLGRRVVYVASGDLSHKLLESGPYGFAPEGPQFDEKVTHAFSTGDLLSLLTMDRGFAERAAECGLRSFQIMAGALDRTAIKPELLSYEGPFGVGYGVAAFTPVGEEGMDESRALLEQYEAFCEADLARRKSKEDAYVSLARFSLETYVRERRHVTPSERPGLPTELLSTRAGAFVSLKKDGELRGCIGTIAPVQDNLAEEICANAISAGEHDPRFPPVSASELGRLVYDVDVLGAPEPVESMDQLDPKRYGVIVSCTDGRRGLLLPDLDGIDTVSEQISIAARKGGIDLCRDTYQLQRFEVVRHT
ncbi:AmmeMemoRadiSam system protein A [Olsenella sp. Marseille-P4559]|uniref:AmmeMemoRadiSam system protein A n=1 Tax=Olsenella sp. Marseille-P4559 TaxID=2364795 RepID=UPI00102F545C|nr:AmmeMemoRadiSam system protein A [Olsenella sp. Marseille-P4559]